MSSTTLKIIAVISMALSHTYSLLFPQYGVLYLIGRLAFPLFAWFIAEGAVHTKNIRIYLLRLFLLAAVSQLPYVMAHRISDPSFWELNVVFTLFCGLLSVAILMSKRPLVYKAAAVVCLAAASEILLMDYGAVGVLSIVSFHMYRKQPGYLILAQVVLIISMLAYPAYEIWKSGQFHIHNMLYFGNALALLALPLILLHNEKRGINLQYFFYIFYPAHFIALYFIKLWLT